MNLSVKMWCGVILQALGTLLACIALGTPSWIVGSMNNGTSIYSIGVWKACMDLTCVSVYEYDRTIVRAIGEWLYGVEAGMTLGFILYLGATIATFVIYVSERFAGQYNRLMHIALVLFIGVISIFYASFLYAYEAESRIFNVYSQLTFGLAFYMSIASITFGLSSAIIYYLEYKDQTNVRRNYLVLN